MVKNRCRANMAHVRQSTPDYGLGLARFWPWRSSYCIEIGSGQVSTSYFRRQPNFGIPNHPFVLPPEAPCRMPGLDLSHIQVRNLLAIKTARTSDEYRCVQRQQLAVISCKDISLSSDFVQRLQLVVRPSEERECLSRLAVSERVLTSLPGARPPRESDVKNLLESYPHIRKLVRGDFLRVYVP